MKTMIISGGQLHLISEEMDNYILKPGDDNEEILDKIEQVETEPYSVSFEDGEKSENDPNIPVQANVEPGSPVGSLAASMEAQYASDPFSDKKSITAVIDNGKVMDGKIYTKKAIEEARIMGLREHGIRYTKSEINKFLLGE